MLLECFRGTLCCLVSPNKEACFGRAFICLEPPGLIVRDLSLLGSNPKKVKKSYVYIHSPRSLKSYGPTGDYTQELKSSRLFFLCLKNRGES